MPQHNHILRKTLITLLVSLLCIVVVYFTWGRGSLYMLKPESSPSQKSEQKAQKSAKATENRSQQERDDEHDESDPEKPARLCMLNSGKCPLSFTKQEAGKQIVADIEAIPSNIISLESIVFRVHGAEFSQLRAVISGLNMDMGDVEVVFHKVDDELYEGRAILASCTEEIMQYRMHLESGESSAAVDFDAKRKEQ